MTTTPQPAKAAGVACVAFTLLGWSSVPLFLRYFADYIDAWTANGWRYGISAIFWAPLLVVVARGKGLPPGLWRAALLPSVFNCLGQVCFAWAPYFIKPGLLTFLLRLQIIFVAAGAYLLFPSERPVMRTRRYRIGLVVVFLGSCGTVLLRGEWPRGGTAFGVLLGILSGLLYGGYALSVRRNMQGVHPVTAFAAISQYTALGMVALMLACGRNFGLEAWSLTRAQLGVLVVSAFVGIALGHVFYYVAIGRLGVAVSSGIIQLQPFFTGVASFFLFDERLTAGQWLSGFAALGGAVLILSTQRRVAPTRPRGSERDNPPDE
jgi:drug/metabolite transporter (DMT)-like permease